MAILRGLRNALLKYRKRRKRPIGTPIPGYAGQCDYVRPVTRVPGDDYVISPGSVATPEVYMGDLPDEYIPEVGFMDIPEPDYGSYEAPFVQAPFTPAPQGFGPLPQDVVQVEYDDSLMDQELFEHEMKLAGSIEPISLDQVVEHNANLDMVENVLDFGDISDRLIPPVDIMPEMSIPSPVADTADAYSLPPIEPLSGQMNYAAVDPQDFFVQQMRMMENQFDQFDPSAQMEAAFNAHEALFEQSQHALPFEPAIPGPSMGRMGPMPGPASLDDIIEAHGAFQGSQSSSYGPEMPAYGNGPMTQELFEHQMHEAAGQMGAPDAAPDPYDDGTMSGQMYGEAMPYDAMDPDMMDPRMMNPYMMPGPMGPNFMPDPPPGP